MEPSVIFERRISWHDWRLVGFRPIDLASSAGRYWLDFCRRYGDIRVHFYDDYVLAQLTERRGQIRIPVVIPYNEIYLEHKGDLSRIRMQYPEEYIVLPISDKNLTRGNFDDLIKAISEGVQRETDRSIARGFEIGPQYYTE